MRIVLRAATWMANSEIRSVPTDSIKTGLVTVIPVAREQPGVYFIHRIKCLNCSLHFALYSWRKNLLMRNYSCPECQHSFTQGRYLWCREERHGDIFEEHPGKAETVELKP